MLNEAKDRDAFFAGIADRVRALAVTYSNEKVNSEFMSRLPKLEIVSSFGVGYDHVDAKWAGAHGIVVTNTPDVLNEEVADTALGLLLCTVREFPQADRYLRAGKWEHKAVSAERGDAAQPHRRDGRHGADRQGDRASVWTLSGCRSSIIRGGPRRASPTSTTPTSSPWRATSTC